MLSRIYLLGIPIDSVSLPQAVSMLRAWIKESKQRHVMTVNNEMLVESFRNAEFRVALQNTALNVADSTGVIIGATLTGQQLAGRVPGVDLVTALCDSLDETTSVFLLGAAEGVAGIASQELRKMNPKLKIAGVMSGSPKPDYAEGIVRTINQSGACLLLVAFGAPKQDLWIRRYMHDMPSVRVAMGVGGTFDFLAGYVKRAPKWMRAAGLEWLWRFIKQPWRFARIKKATIVYLFLLLLYGKKAP